MVCNSSKLKKQDTSILYLQWLLKLKIFLLYKTGPIEKDIASVRHTSFDFSNARKYFFLRVELYVNVQFKLPMISWIQLITIQQ